MKIRILIEAEAEIQSARRYFNSHATALGSRFLDDLEETLQKIEANPYGFPKLETLPDSEPYQRAIFKVFRYAVIYEILPDELLVIAVVHTSRKPNYWAEAARLDSEEKEYS